MVIVQTCWPVLMPRPPYAQRGVGDRVCWEAWTSSPRCTNISYQSFHSYYG